MKFRLIGVAGAILVAVLFLGGCGAHAGFEIGKSSNQTLAQAHQTSQSSR